MKVLCFAAALLFVFSGAASASLLSDVLFKTPTGVNWANLKVYGEYASDTWTYTYELSVLNGDGDFKATVHRLEIPILPLDIYPPPPGYDPNSVELLGDVNYKFWVDDYDFLVVYFGPIDASDPDQRDGLLAGQTARIMFDSEYNPEDEYIYIVNGGPLGEVKAAAPVSGETGGPSSVPEPASVILFGISMLGIGVCRHLSKRTRV